MVVRPSSTAARTWVGQARALSSAFPARPAGRYRAAAAFTLRGAQTDAPMPRAAPAPNHRIRWNTAPPYPGTRGWAPALWARLWSSEDQNRAQVEVISLSGLPDAPAGPGR